MKKTLAALLIAGAIAFAGTWTYTSRVLIPYQVSDSAAHNRPRGNLSDLYPRWLGARELLLHGRDPYSPEVSREIQAGYYGRVLDPSHPEDPKDQQGFVYPLYVVFYLAPTVHASFHSVQHVFFWTLVALTIASVPIWLAVLDWSVPVTAQLTIIAYTFGSLGAMQGLKLQQLTLFVVPLIAIALLLMTQGHQAAGGVLLALATIKPQLVWLLLVCLVIWTTGDWRRRWRWLAWFLGTMMVLVLASEWLLPDWFPKFLQAMRAYRQYTGSVSVVEELVPHPWSWLIEIVALGATLYVTWLTRRCAAHSVEFVRTMSVILATTVFILPAFAPYNQLLLLPAILLAIQQRDAMWRQRLAVRTLMVTTAAVLVWPWLATSTLAALSYVLSPERMERYWAVPFWTSLAIPVAVGALMLVYTLGTPVTSPAQRTA